MENFFITFSLAGPDIVPCLLNPHYAVKKRKVLTKGV